MEVDLTATAGAAPVHRRVAGYTRYELGLLARNGEQLLLTVIIPVALLIGLASFADRLDIPRSQIAPNVIGIAVIATAFTSLAIATSFERRSASLQLLATTPLSTVNLLAGKALAVAVFEVVQLAGLVVVALALGLGPIALLPVLGVVVLGTLAFASLGFFVAGVLRAEAVLAVANGLFLFFLVGCGLTVPLTAFPSAWADVMQFTPAAALATALQSAAMGSLDVAAVCVLCAWGVAAALLARVTFRWES